MNSCYNIIMLKFKISNPSWALKLADEFCQEYMINLQTFLNDELKHQKNIYPPSHLLFNALELTPFEEIKVVILGQDPYPTRHHAHGLAFSVQDGIFPLPKSLKNINIELMSDLGIDNAHRGNLEEWAKQGVLMINSVLSVEEGRTNSHKNIGWERFTDKIIKIVNDACQNVVFILWGANAQKKGSFIDTKKHHIITSAHPSPLSAYRGFFGSRVFSKTNDYLKQHHKKEINWQLSKIQK